MVLRCFTSTRVAGSLTHWGPFFCTSDHKRTFFNEVVNQLLNNRHGVLENFVVRLAALILMTLSPRHPTWVLKTFVLAPTLFGVIASLLTSPQQAKSEGIDECKIINQVLNRLGNAMAINRVIVASSSDPIRVEKASSQLAEQTKSYRNTKKQRSKAGCDGQDRNMRN